MIYLHEPDHFGSANLLIIMSFTNNTFGVRVLHLMKNGLFFISVLEFTHHFMPASMLCFLFLFCEFAHHLVLEELGNSHEVHEGDTKDERNEPTHLKYDNHNTNDNYHIEPSHLKNDDHDINFS